jgi:hypothetical protein
VSFEIGDEFACVRIPDFDELLLAFIMITSRNHGRVWRVDDCSYPVMTGASVDF